MVLKSESLFLNVQYGIFLICEQVWTFLQDPSLRGLAQDLADKYFTHIYLLSSLAHLGVGRGSVNDNIPHVSSEFTTSWLDLALIYNSFCHSLRRKKLHIGSFFIDIKLDPGKLCVPKSCFHQAVMNCSFLSQSYF